MRGFNAGNIARVKVGAVGRDNGLSAGCANDNGMAFLIAVDPSAVIGIHKVICV